MQWCIVVGKIRGWGGGGGGGLEKFGSCPGKLIHRLASLCPDLIARCVVAEYAYTQLIKSC